MNQNTILMDIKTELIIIFIYMPRTIFKITFFDDSYYYTTSRLDVVDKINHYHKDDDTFKKYNINTINGVLYNNNKCVRGVKDVENFGVRDFYKEYIDTYTEKIHGSSYNNGKKYSQASINRLQQQFIEFINTIFLQQTNSGETDDSVREHIYKMAKLEPSSTPTEKQKTELFFVSTRVLRMGKFSH